MSNLSQQYIHKMLYEKIMLTIYKAIDSETDAQNIPRQDKIETEYLMNEIHKMLIEILKLPKNHAL